MFFEEILNLNAYFNKLLIKKKIGWEYSVNHLTYFDSKHEQSHITLDKAHNRSLNIIVINSVRMFMTLKT